ncbi:T-complex protein 1 subunit gamma-like [Sycon ciliatum]|uniref:T-complex protein 1 subunit gamma-like n=1 Tax=Sycon ciliatum TaxID=27933 RepID=UPI0020AA514B|eukprot:scpid59772/ scgid20027/ T-complex protein 1 subunit gamma; CCT-gamma
MAGRGGPVLVLKDTTKRESGRKVQLGNIEAAKTIADLVRTSLGPCSMLKMLMDPMGGVVMTNDGNAILREIQVQHPAAKAMLDISRAVDEEVGDGTTSVIILAGEMLLGAEKFLKDNIHPTVIIGAYRKALDDAVTMAKEQISVPVDVNNREQVLKIINSCIGTKMIRTWADKACNMAYDAVATVKTEDRGRMEVDIKRYVRVEKVPGGSVNDSCTFGGCMLNKDVVHTKMRRRIENPRIILLDCNLEYKKGESMTNLEISNEADFTRILELEEKMVKQMCDDIIKLKPDLVITEKGISDLAQHYLLQNNISALRRTRKTDNNRIARATGATIVNRTDELKESDIGTGCGMFEVRKIGDEYFSFIENCKNPKACTILLRGASKDVLKEVERNLQDALHVARNIMVQPNIAAGGGALEMALQRGLTEKAKSVDGIQQGPYQAVADALEIIPSTLIQNCGSKPLRVLTELRAKHSQGLTTYGIDGETGKVVDMNEYGVWDPLNVRLQAIKTSVETAILLLRIDDIVSGVKKSQGEGN